ncbi:PREDICTED: uncharacterized protein LOC106813287 [Priapulus caudatus]|uniref:Sex-determining region Y protein n=1 Tax=Priapulus caudatus TaxID=37621 RepID=A0ABM1EL11_PRICU|nr:PREDICTED: uncharacterized protein LOC106813287 [Priapulus caudatus]
MCVNLVGTTTVGTHLVDMPLVRSCYDMNGTKIPRPSNAFMVFSNEHRKFLADKFQGEGNNSISIRLGDMWKSLNSPEKAKYFEEARRLDLEHKAMYPNYQYCPKENRKRKENFLDITRTCCQSNHVSFDSKPCARIPKPKARKRRSMKSNQLYAVLPSQIPNEPPMLVVFDRKQLRQEQIEALTGNFRSDNATHGNAASTCCVTDSLCDDIHGSLLDGAATVVASDHTTTALSANRVPRELCCGSIRLQDSHGCEIAVEELPADHDHTRHSHGQAWPCQTGHSLSSDSGYNDSLPNIYTFSHALCENSQQGSPCQHIDKQRISRKDCLILEHSYNHKERVQESQVLHIPEEKPVYATTQQQGIHSHDQSRFYYHDAGYEFSNHCQRELLDASWCHKEMQEGCVSSLQQIGFDGDSHVHKPHVSDMLSGSDCAYPSTFDWHSAKICGAGGDNNDHSHFPWDRHVVTHLNGTALSDLVAHDLPPMEAANQPVHITEQKKSKDVVSLRRTVEGENAQMKRSWNLGYASAGKDGAFAFREHNTMGGCQFPESDGSSSCGDRVSAFPVNSVGFSSNGNVAATATFTANDTPLSLENCHLDNAEHTEKVMQGSEQAVSARCDLATNILSTAIAATFPEGVPFGGV